MTQTQPDRLDQIESFIERMDRKLDIITADLVEIKIAQAKSEERFKSIDTQLSDIKIQLRGQDTRLWGFIVTLSLAIIGFLGKLAFFPDVKA